jgi:hypothetical protein
VCVVILEASRESPREQSSFDVVMLNNMQISDYIHLEHRQNTVRISTPVLQVHGQMWQWSGLTVRTQ